MTEKANPKHRKTKMVADDLEPQMSLDAKGSSEDQAEIVLELDPELLHQAMPSHDEGAAEVELSESVVAEDQELREDEDEALVLAEEEKPQIDMSLKAMAEAIIFASDKPIKEGDILPIIQSEQPDIAAGEVKAALAELHDEYQQRAGGFTLELIKGQGYQFRTVKEAAPLMMNKFASRPRPLSKAAMETLAIVAYRQPVTRADVEFIRGVDAGNIIKNLLERDLIKCTGRKEDAPGKPMQFGTSGEFLRVFRLQTLKELPPLASFQPHREDLNQASERLENREDADEAAAAFLDGELQGPLPEGEKQLLLSDSETDTPTPSANRESDEKPAEVRPAIDVEAVEVEASERQGAVAAETPEPKEPEAKEVEPSASKEPSASIEPEQPAAKPAKRILSEEEASEEFGDELEAEAAVEGATAKADSAEDDDDDELFDPTLIEVEIEPEKDDR